MDTFAVLMNWNKHDKSLWNIGITTITNLGAMTGALSAGSFLKFGKLRVLLILNVVLLISIGICMV